MSGSEDQGPRVGFQAQLAQFEPLLEAIAAIAQGDDEGREEVEGILADLETHGWHLRGAVQRIWAGDRDTAALTAGLDEHDTTLIQRILVLVADGASTGVAAAQAAPTPNEIFARLPDTVRDALSRQDEAAFKQALDTLSAEEQQAVLVSLQVLRQQAQQPVAPPTPTEIFAHLPMPVRAALERQDIVAFEQALLVLPPAEQQAVLASLRMLQQQAQQQITPPDPAQIFASLPDPIRAAMTQQDAGAFEEALALLPPEEQQAILASLQVLQQRTQGQMGPAAQLAQFEPLLEAIAAIAQGDDEGQAEVEEILADLETRGWHLQSAVQRIWAGDRDTAALTAGLDEQDSTLVQRLLELVAIHE